MARHLAQHFGLLNLETGAMYRAFALKAIRSDMDFDDSAALERLARDTEITLEADRHGNRVLLDGQDVTERIRDSRCHAGSFAGKRASRDSLLDGRICSGSWGAKAAS